MYGPTSQPWSSIVSFYEGLPQSTPALSALTALARGLAASAFPAAGLAGLTSMHALIVGPTESVLDNPHLVITYEVAAGTFLLRYPSADRVEWTRHASPEEALGIITSFLTRRARWYRHTDSAT